MPSSTSISADEVCRAPRGHVITGGGAGFRHAACGVRYRLVAGPRSVRGMRRLGGRGQSECGVRDAACPISTG